MDLHETVETKVYFSPLNAVSQTFSLPNSLIYYILKNPVKKRNINVSFCVYLKLNQTCKYFFIKEKIISCWLFSIRKKYCFIKDIKKTNKKYYKFSHIHDKNIKFCLSHHLCFDCDLENPSYLSNFIRNKFSYVNLTCLDVHYQTINYEEFIFLVGKNLSTFIGYNFFIKQQNGSFLNYDGIFKALPKVIRFEYGVSNLKDEIVFENQHLETLIDEQRKPLKTFSVSEVSKDINAEIFLKFLKKYSRIEGLSKDALKHKWYETPVFIFKDGVNPIVANAFKAIIEKGINEWDINSAKPDFSVFLNHWRL